MGKRGRPSRHPEAVAADPSSHYAAGEPERYTAQNAAIQADLTLACAHLLGLDAPGAPPGRLIVDAGCGSGLSSALLAAPPFAAAVVGFDVARPMLAAAAAAAPALRGNAVLADGGAPWPFAPSRADAAVSVSAAQWLLHAPSPTRALAAFFTSLVAALRPGAGAVAQIYTRTNGEAAALAEAARGAGAAAALVVDTPHARGGARKTFLCMVAPPPPPPRGDGGGDEGAAAAAAAAFAAASAGPRRDDCWTAWPRAATGCALWWRAAVAPALAGGDAALPPVHARLLDQHARGALRLARVARRARGGGGAAAAFARRLEAWRAAPACNACAAPVLVSVFVAAAATDRVDPAALAAAVGAEGGCKAGDAPPSGAAARAGAAGAAPGVALLPTAAPGVALLAAPGVARFLVADVAVPGAEPAAAAVAAAAGRAARAAAAARASLVLVGADVAADGSVTAFGVWHARNTVAEAGDAEAEARALRDGMDDDERKY